MRKREKRDGRRKLMFVTFGKKEAKEPESERGTTTLLLNINMGLIVDDGGGGEDDDDNKDDDDKDDDREDEDDDDDDKDDDDDDDNGARLWGTKLIFL